MCVFCVSEKTQAVKWGYYDSERLMTLSRGKASLPQQHLSFLNRLVFHCARNILMHVMLLCHACSNYVQTGLLKATLVNNVRSPLSHVVKCVLHSHACSSLSSAVHERMFRNQIRRYLISNHINTQFISPPHTPPRVRPLFAEASWCGTWQWCRMRWDTSPGVSCQSQRFSTPIHSPRFPV